jgi:hypothetical protein
VVGALNNGWWMMKSLWIEGSEPTSINCHIPTLHGLASRRIFVKINSNLSNYIKIQATEIKINLYSATATHLISPTVTFSFNFIFLIIPNLNTQFETQDAQTRSQREDPPLVGKKFFNFLEFLRKIPKIRRWNLSFNRKIPGYAAAQQRSFDEVLRSCNYGKNNSPLIKSLLFISVIREINSVAVFPLKNQRKGMESK